MMMLEWMDIWIDLSVVNFKYQICFREMEIISTMFVGLNFNYKILRGRNKNRRNIKGEEEKLRGKSLINLQDIVQFAQNP